MYFNLGIYTCTEYCNLPIPEIGTALFNQLVGSDFLDKMTTEKMIFWNASQYVSAASDAEFKQMFMIVIPHYPKWKNLDDYINSMYGWFQGEFDPTKFDQEALYRIKKEYGNGPVTQLEPICNLHAILTKTIY